MILIRTLAESFVLFYSVDRGPHKYTACENSEKARLFTLKKLLHTSGCKLKVYCVLLVFYPQFAAIVSINPKKNVNQNENQNVQRYSFSSGLLLVSCSFRLRNVIDVTYSM